MSKAKNCKILLGMTADVLRVVLTVKYEQSSTHDLRTLRARKSYDFSLPRTRPELTEAATFR